MPPKQYIKGHDMISRTLEHFGQRMKHRKKSVFTMKKYKLIWGHREMY